jgi:hypothetical protein
MENAQQHIFRQGDVILTKTPNIAVKTCENTGSKTIALGEITGHHHSFRSQDQVLVFKDQSNPEPKYVQVESGQTAILEHQEHLPLEIPEGVYTCSIQQEYNPFLENMVRVVD